MLPPLQCHNPEDHDMNLHRRENLKSRKTEILVENASLVEICPPQISHVLIGISLCSKHSYLYKLLTLN
jgi:hypothetical protein